nr:hypothetical protein [Tanacetum cinerariifolium]
CRASDRMCLHVDDKEHELGDLGEPANYKVTLLDPESDKWLDAVNVEMQSMKDNEVWDLVDLPLNGEIIGSKWIFKKKTHMDDIRAIWILIVIAAFYDYEIWQIDIKTAFLNGHLSEEVYIVQPEGFANPKFPDQVCKLKHSICGLKQAFRQWNKGFDDEIKIFNFIKNRDEPCVYMKASGSYVTFLILYVDNILIMENNIPMLQYVKSYLERCFSMKDLRESAYILGIKIYRDRSKRLIGLCQSAYIEKILKRYLMKNSKCETIPMQEKMKLSKSQGASTPAKKQRMLNVPYTLTFGSIMYAVRCTRPDVTFVQNITYIRAIWILIVIAAFYDYEIWQIDIKTAFLNGHLSEEVYIVQPEGFANPKFPDQVQGKEVKHLVKIKYWKQGLSIIKNVHRSLVVVYRARIKVEPQKCPNGL